MNWLRLALTGMALALAACSEPGGTSFGLGGKSEPDDPDLAKIYKQTCRACHGTGVGGAPQTGRKGEWASRVSGGMDQMLERTIDGYKGMPPLGGCVDCSADDFIALIEFMADIEEE